LSDQFDRGLIEHLCDIANCIKEFAATKQGSTYLQGLLSHKRAMLYFTQASTRTFLSFTAACQLLGLTCNEIRDASVSSEFKGESPLDSVRMFSSYFDIVIMRSITPDLAECSAYLMNDLDEFNQRSVPIVNGGSGADEHPTQALLDMYTIHRTFEFSARTDTPTRNRFGDLRRKYPTLTRGPSHKTYAFVGDIARGRTVRSIANLLSLYEGVTMHFVSPDAASLRLRDDLRAKLVGRGVEVHEHHDISEVVELADIIYMTRIQKEHDKRPDYTPEDVARCSLSVDLVARMKDYAGIMHPFPRNQEIPFELDHDPRVLYFRQARNGMWARAALIAYLFDMDGRIASHHRKVFAEGERHNYNRESLA